MEERIGFLDIETSNLDANFGVILSWCIKIKDGDIIYGLLNDKDFKEKEAFKVDKRIIRNLIDEILKLDRIVTHYGRKFDIPFIRTRALINGLEFPSFGTIVNDDTYYMAKYKLKLNSNRLETIAQTLFGKSKKTHLDGAIWLSAVRGDKKALNYVLDHNKTDVIEGERVWLEIRKFVGVRNTSI
jgi:uncharacterized protein YprB with RNaseH-like and TPR domain